MKKVFVFAATIALVAGSFTSCKKGENDPFISLKSRKARLTGEWVVTKAEFVDDYGSSTTTTTIDGETMTVDDGSSESTYKVNEFKLTMNKEGTYSQVQDVSLTEVDGTSVPSGTYDQTDETDGQWAFIGKSKDAELKNKEAIAMNVLSSSTTTNGSSSEVSYDGWDSADIMLIDQLKNKEIIFKGEYSTTSGGSTTTHTYSITAEKQ